MNTSSHSANLSTKFYVAFVCITGASIMMLEFAASRLLAPWFGTSLFVWGNVIGVMLIALSAGYYIGGKQADAKPDSNRLMWIVTSAGLFSAGIPVLSYIITYSFDLGEMINATSTLGIVVGSFFAIVILFVIPIFLLGMVSPYVIRLATHQVENAGSVAGSLYAASTLGSIVGTFASTFFLVPFLGSRETILLSSASLILVAAVGNRSWWWRASLLLAPLVVYILFANVPLRANGSGGSQVLYEAETAYQYVQLRDEADRLAFVYNEGLGTQSYYMKTGVLTGAYYDYVSLAPYLTQNAEAPHILVLGMAGGTVTRQFDHYFPNSTITGVEIDPEVVEIANQYFHLGEQSTKVVVADARPFLRSTEDTYDVVVVDAYANELYIPWHLVTTEFFNELKSTLNPGGVVAMNVGSSDETSNLFQSIVTTLETQFAEVRVVAIPNSSNFLVLASQQPMDFSTLANVTDDRLPLANRVRTTAHELEHSTNGIVLNDNRSPVEVFTEQMVLNAIL